MNATLVRSKRRADIEDDWPEASAIPDPVGWPPVLPRFEAGVDLWKTATQQIDRLSRVSSAVRPIAIDNDVRQQFEELVQRWEAATLFSSSALEICTDRSYQRIIGLGMRVVPLIMERLAAGSHHWDWALSAITQADPAEGCETIAAVSEAWLKWGRAHGYVSDVG